MAEDAKTSQNHTLKFLRLQSLFALSCTLSACSTQSRTPISLPTQSCSPKNQLTDAELDEISSALNIVGGTSAGNLDEQERSTSGILIYNKISGNSTPLLTVCTGVVAGKNVLLTAAQCFTKPEGTTSQLVYSFFKSDLSGITNSDLIEAKEVILNPNYSSTSGEISNNDIAILKLSSQVPATQLVPSFVSSMDALSSNTEISMIGYGSEGTSDINFGFKRRTNSFIKDLINETNYPGKQVQNQIRVLDTSGTLGRKRGICTGDYGAPGFLLGKAEVFGVVQGFNTKIQAAGTVCEDGDFNYTLVAPFIPWIEDTISYKLNVSGTALPIDNAPGWTPTGSSATPTATPTPTTSSQNKNGCN